MPIRRKRATNDDIVERLDTLLIVQLTLASVPQHAIREIVGVNLNRVSKIVQLVNRRRSKGEG
jgi:hypothetical protein